MRLFAAALVVAVSMLLLAGAVPAARDYPAFWVFADQGGVAQAGGTEFDWDGLQNAASPEKIVLSFPGTYALSLARTLGSKLGTAVVRATGGSVFNGALIEMDPAAYSASTSAQACDPGSHPAVWEMSVKSSAGTALTIPIAVDKSAGEYRLTMCFDDEHAQNISISEIDIARSSGVTTPKRPGKYLFDSIVTPFATDGTAEASSAYELRAYELYPRDIKIAAGWFPIGKLLEVTGQVTLDGKPVTSGRPVDIYVNVGSTAAAFRQIGTATTTANGHYTLAKKLAKVPKYVDATLENTSFAACAGSSSAPAGCSSYSVSGGDSGYVKVTR